MANGPVTGETTYNARNRTVGGGETKWIPVPKGDYELRIRTDRAEVGVPSAPGKVPYAKGVSFELVNPPTDPGDGTRYSRRIFHYVSCDLTPGKDGKANIDRPAGLTQLQQTLDNYPDFDVIEKDVGGDKGTITMLNPRSVVAWLKTLDGQIIKGHVDTERRLDGDPEAKVKFFIMDQA